MKELTPAQERIIQQLDDKLTSYVGWSTDPAKNTVHAPATETLAKKGLVEIVPSQDHPGRRLARLTQSAQDALELTRPGLDGESEEPMPPTQPSARPPPPAPPPPGGKGQRSGVRRKKAEADKRAQAEAAKAPRKADKPRSPFEPEPDALKKARARIKTLIAGATTGHPPQAVHLVLAIVNQETGNHKAANALIEEYKLDEMFGLRRFS
jgi:hypothetical protein